MKSNKRPRVNSSYTSDDNDLTSAEKQELLSTFPSDVQLNEDLDDNDDDNDNGHRHSHDAIDEKNGDKNDAKNVQRSNQLNANVQEGKNEDVSESEEELDVIKMNNDDDNNDERNNDDNDDENNNNQQQTLLLEKAKSKLLSKWSLRLFDPNRRRGLIEAPTVIPLNDEFLTDFGKREKELDKIIGRDMHIDQEKLDLVDAIGDNGDDNSGDKNDDNDSNNYNNDGKTNGNKSQNEIEAKVKISNLAYSTTQQKLTQTCETHGGPVLQVNLLMDEYNPHLSKGRAYVIFETLEGRDLFIKQMNEKSFDGRIIRIVPITQQQRRKRDSFSGGITSGGGASLLSRYWDKDITTKCYRCGQIGHMSSNCPNEEIQKPCPFCARKGHDSFSCPLSKICFNCGIPGHLNRDCPERRGVPRRIVCGICFMNGHHRYVLL